ncbi:MAG: hypothetical protein IKU47_08060 [Oscillospiraceae bacterium]|nr:hypothetical protein [Oscillospiraceae bacterium]
MKESTIHIKSEFIITKKHDDDYSFKLDKVHIAESLKDLTGADDVLVTSASVIEREIE